MRRTFAARTLVGSTVLAALLGLCGAADPPLILPPPKPLDEPRKLRTELEALAAERDAAAKDLSGPVGDGAEKAKLRAQLLELLKKVGEKKAIPAMPPATTPAEVVPRVKEPPPPPPVPKFTYDENTKPKDALRAAQNYFRSGDVEAAYRILTNVDLNAFSKEDRVFAQYLTACCLRKLNKPAAAAELYREVADKKEDTFLAEYAVTQLGMMKSIAELETNLEQLRSRRKSK